MSGVRTRVFAGAAEQTTALAWVRDELRVHDNAVFARAFASDAVLPVFCFDPRVYHEGKCSAMRARFVLEAVTDLRSTLRARGSDLLVRVGSPAAVLAELAAASARAEPSARVEVVHSATACSEEHADEQSVRSAVGAAVPLSAVWEGTMYHIDDLDSRHLPDDLFTSWRTRVEKAKTPIRPEVVFATKPLPRFATAMLAAQEQLPTLRDLGYCEAEAECDGRGDFFAPVGGETAALARLQRYVFDEDRLRTYFDTRNGMMGQGYSTKLAPWLARGCISPRRVALECRRYEVERGIVNKSTYWVVFELTWRDYFVFFARKSGARLFWPSGVKGLGKSHTWLKNDRAALDAWSRGATGVPLVDANMRELNATGFMSNRGRQNVASYLVLDLGVDWRKGAAYFEEKLVDYTPEANWGNWHAAAGLTGGRVNKFNILKQSNDYDKQGAYVKLWCPELAKVPAPKCFEPHKLSHADRQTYGCEHYPAPLPTRAFQGGGDKRGGGGGGGGGGKKRDDHGAAKARGGERDTIRRQRKASSDSKTRVQSAWND